MGDYLLYLFDLSGTLIDDSLAIYNADMKLLSKLNLLHLNKPSVMDYLNYKSQFKSWKDYYFSLGISETEVEYVGNLFLNFYSGEIENVRLFSETKEVIERLKNSGKRMALITLLDRERANKLLKHLGLANIFDLDSSVFYGDKRLQRHKPSPDPIYLALENSGICKERAVFVGDSLEDYLAGTAAGVKTFIVKRDERLNFNIPEPKDVEIIKSLLELL